MITASNVSKVFLTPKDRRRTLKDHFVKILQKREFREINALSNVSLSIKKGEFLGIIGPNGSGKSTLLKIIAGVYLPTSGSIQARGEIAPFLELGVGFHRELSVRDNIYLHAAIIGLRRRNVRLDKVLGFAGLEGFENATLKNLSSGMKSRLGFAASIQANADIYLVDEVLAVGDESFKKKCFATFKRLKAKGKTILLVSHNLNAVQEFCTRVIVLDKGNIIYDGDAKSAVREYLKRSSKEAE